MFKHTQAIRRLLKDQLQYSNHIETSYQPYKSIGQIGFYLMRTLA